MREGKVKFKQGSIMPNVQIPSLGLQIPRLPFPTLTESCHLSLGLLTHNIKLVGVVDAAILVLHDAGVVALVRGHHRVHYDAPGGITNL